MYKTRINYANRPAWAKTTKHKNDSIMAAISNPDLPITVRRHKCPNLIKGNINEKSLDEPVARIPLIPKVSSLESKIASPRSGKSAMGQIPLIGKVSSLE